MQSMKKLLELRVPADEDSMARDRIGRAGRPHVLAGVVAHDRSYARRPHVTEPVSSPRPCAVAHINGRAAKTNSAGCSSW